ncbi:GIY-YIG nuclease family protein [Gordonia sp. HY002]|uniref:GIY-YIG nuclease family protein n=1 Tax=Gordonia zhenghanii TaxID=2911516 RepID=UPI001EEF86D4|nr:GIY-YIG nuclease family protein [Gordonia zhenghanii]MCF8568824.1 GIY-YIG nuclease family protein [Gordonia zhenghanii]MCF8602306.1 GIY-YIG nuclease family protein [Gordonia zhenghanii]
MAAYVYILRCGDGSYYVGSTRNLDHRVWQHMTGAGGVYTAKRQPVELVFSEEFSNIGEAYAMEKRIQNWSRAKREALIRGDFGALHDAARCRNETSSERRE